MERKGVAAALVLIFFATAAYPLYCVIQISQKSSQVSIVGDEGQDETSSIEKNVVLVSEQNFMNSLAANPKTRPRLLELLGEETQNPEIARIIVEVAEAQNLPLELAFALAWVESRFDPRAVNRNPGSIDRGLFQLNSRSFPKIQASSFFDPKLNAELGLEYLKGCLDEAGNEVAALAMYNAGPYRVSQTGAPRMTLDYISKIQGYKASLAESVQRAFPPVEMVHEPLQGHVAVRIASGSRIDS